MENEYSWVLEVQNDLAYLANEFIKNLYYDIGEKLWEESDIWTGNDLYDLNWYMPDWENPDWIEVTLYPVSTDKNGYLTTDTMTTLYHSRVHRASLALNTQELSHNER